MFYSVASFLMRVLMTILTKLEVSGLERVPLKGPLIIVANHLHFADPPLLGAVIPRKIIFMAKSELFRIPVIGLIVLAYEAFGVRRGMADARAIRRAIKVLRSDKALGIFPEGHRSKDGKLQRARKGMALLAYKTGATILPIGISGTRTFLQWPRVLQRPRVMVTIGEPLCPPVLRSPSREQQAELSEEIMRRIAACLPEDQRGPYSPDDTGVVVGEAEDLDEADLAGAATEARQSRD